MADKRKLLADVEKCFKKVDEGVELFHDTMLRLQDTYSENQRDRCQDDLKKEIKKLQRLRDQLKGWQSSSDVKDKDKLNQYRKIIEKRMEQFKDIERGNKTKSHSKQGLCAEERLDPKEKEKAGVIEWLQNQIRELGVESDRTEMKIESVNNADGGKRRGKKDDGKNGENEKTLEKLNDHLEKIKFHIGKLEVCMRVVNNESLEASLVIDALKDSVEMYIEALDPDYDGHQGGLESLDLTGCYDDLNLTQLSVHLATVNTSTTEEEKLDAGKTTTSKSHDVASSSQKFINVGPPNPVPEPTIVASVKSTSDDLLDPAMMSMAVTLSVSSLPAGIPHRSAPAGQVVATSTTLSPIASTTGTTYHIVPTVARHSSSQSKAPEPIVTRPSLSAPLIKMTTDTKKTIIDTTETTYILSNGNATDISTISSAFDKAIGAASTYRETATSSKQHAFNNAEMGAQAMKDAHRLREADMKNADTNFQKAVTPAMLVFSPLGPVEIPAQHLPIMEGVEDGIIPDNSERLRNYLPKIKYPSSPSYPKEPRVNADTVDYYLKLSAETLFFVFYYMEGTNAQLLAAKALKRYSWRFHTKYRTWFQRHGDPKEITNYLERGTYRYFNFVTWTLETMDNFTFEYRYLEDQEL